MICLCGHPQHVFQFPAQAPEPCPLKACGCTRFRLDRRAASEAVAR